MLLEIKGPFLCPEYRVPLRKATLYFQHHTCTIVIDHSLCKNNGTLYDALVLCQLYLKTINDQEPSIHHVWVLPAFTWICPARVGLAVKGAKPDEVSRGDVISVEGAVDVKTEIDLDFQKSPFYKSDIAENQGCLVSIGLQIKAAKFSSISPLKLTFEKPIVCKKGQVAVILKPESTTIRILGSGIIQ